MEASLWMENNGKTCSFRGNVPDDNRHSPVDTISFFTEKTNSSKTQNNVTASKKNCQAQERHESKGFSDDGENSGFNSAVVSVRYQFVS
jgi:hypothetical protein